MKQKPILQVGVKSFLVNKDKMILLLKRNHSKDFGNAIFWDLPGGRIDSRETIEKALKREIKEETGIRSFKILGLLGVQDIFSWSGKHVVRITYISRVTTKKVYLSKEHSEYGWFSIKEASKLPLDRYVMAIIKDKKNMSFINNLIK